MFSLSRKTSEDGLPRAKILPFRKRRNIIALDLEDDILRVAQASGSGSSARVTRLASAKMDIAAAKLEDARALGAALKTTLTSLKISPKDAVLSLSRAQVVLRPLQVPVAEDMREL